VLAHISPGLYQQNGVRPDHHKENELTEPISDDRRKEIFAAVVAAQDEGEPVQTSRALVANRFGVSEENVRTIEREGLDNGWPPLE
jgi:hypothetical protein